MFILSIFDNRWLSYYETTGEVDGENLCLGAQFLPAYIYSLLIALSLIRISFSSST